LFTLQQNGNNAAASDLIAGPAEGTAAGTAHQIERSFAY
jgi:hypothetical protein